MDKKSQKKQAISSIDSFSAQYKDPRWQKRRLEIMEYDKFTCQRCGSTEKELNVHHACYHKGNLIWQYANEELITLCTDCHDTIHGMKDLLNECVWHSLFDAYRQKNEVTYDDLFTILMHLVSFDDRELINTLKKIARKIEEETLPFTREELRPINCEDRK